MPSSPRLRASPTIMHFRQIANPQIKMARLKLGDLQQLCKMPSPSFFFSEILFRGTPSRAANRSRAKQPAVVSHSPIPAPNSRAVPIVSCAVRRSRSQYRSPVPLVSVHRTSSSSVGHQFVVPGRQQQNPRYRIDEEGVPGRR